MKGDGKMLIIVQAFGVPHSIWANELLAQIALRKISELGDSEIYIYTQLDIQFRDKDIEGVKKVERINERPGKPPSTFRIVRGAVDYAIKNKIGEIYLVCAGRLHGWRCGRDLVEVVKEMNCSADIHFCQESLIYPKSSWVSADSTQVRTQSLLKWYSWEIPLRIMPFWMYKIIAN